MGGSPLDGLDEVVKPETAAYLERMWTHVQSLTLDEAPIERRRLNAATVIGPTGSGLIVTLTHKAERESWAFITPRNWLGSI